MDSGTTNLEALEADLLARIAASNEEAAIETVRVEALGKSGAISGLMRNLGAMAPEERKAMGAKLNEAKDRIAEALTVRKATLAESALEAKLAAEKVDISLPPAPRVLGAIHPVSFVMEEVARIFGDMGFALEEGPEIETEFNNFDALNTPKSHPARELQDTFYFHPDAKGDRLLLRTHTSPVQVRTMQKQKPPIRMICMGRVYRRDSDATHTPMFHQIEGLVIDETSNLADLKGVLMAFIRAYFEVDDVEVRFRPHFFPFTEPSAEIDVRCDRSGGQVKIGQGSDWLELGGCGMVHPKVLRNCGIDPEKHQGFAWGMGIDRMAMLKYGMPDLRPYFEGDTRWLKHYGFSPYLLPGLAQGLG